MVIPDPLFRYGQIVRPMPPMQDPSAPGTRARINHPDFNVYGNGNEGWRYVVSWFDDAGGHHELDVAECSLEAIEE